MRDFVHKVICVELWRGSDAPCRGISYVWTGLGSPGETNKMIIARIGMDPVNNWVTESVGVAADHERAFGLYYTDHTIKDFDWGHQLK